MIAFKLLTLLVVVFGVARSHRTYLTDRNTDDDNFAKLFKMMENLTNQQQELKVKVMDSLATQNEKLSDFEGKIDHFQDSLAEQYDDIMMRLQIGQVDTINYYYGKVVDSLAIQNEKLSNFEGKVDEKLSNFEGKVVDSLAIQNEKLSNFEVQVDVLSMQNEKLSKCEGKIDHFQNSLTEQYDDIMVKLQVGQVDTINYYYGCDNSTTIPPTEPPTTAMPATEPLTTPEPPTKPPVNITKDCTELYSNGFTSEGVYEIQPENSEPLSVYCQEGWTVIQKRSDDSVNYTKNMEEYGRGFGQIDGEHWLGLNAMNKLTEQGSYTLRFELEAFDGETAWVEYSNFHVSPGTDYTLTFDKSSYRGTAVDQLFYHHNMKFTTIDMDQDIWEGGSCSTDWDYKGDTFGGGGWWFYNCGWSLTSMPYGSHFSINWKYFKDDAALKAAVMKIQRV